MGLIFDLERLQCPCGKEEAMKHCSVPHWKPSALSGGQDVGTRTLLIQ